jgi:hypothetical protein
MRAFRVTALMMEAAHTSETSVYANETTWRYIAEGCHVHTSSREKLKSQKMIVAQLV